MIKIAIIDDYTSDASTLAEWARLPDNYRVDFFQEHITDLEELIAMLIEYEILVVMRERTIISSELIAALPNLKMIITSGMYNAAIDFSAAEENKVLICGTESSGVSTTEQTWALILSLTHNIVSEHNHMMNGLWQQSLATELNQKNLGIIGLGRIGLEVAKIGMAFGMNVFAWSQNLTKDYAEQNGINFIKSKEEICEISDILSLHVRLSERTINLITKQELSIMQDHAFIINTSRGPIINEIDLIEALKNQVIAGAGLDVYDSEPLPKNHSLRKLNNVVLSPHLGYGTKELMTKFFNQILENIEAYIMNKPIRVITEPPDRSTYS